MGQPKTVTEDIMDPVAATEGDSTEDDVISPNPAAEEQAADTPGNDENGDGLPGGQATADVPGDVLGI